MKKALPNITHETVVFTKHARERLDLRKINEDMVIQIMRKPTRTHNADEDKIKFIGKAMGAKVHAICKPIPEENKWLVITLWVRGEEDGSFTSDRKSGNSKIVNLLWVCATLLLLVAFFMMLNFLLPST